VTRKGLPKAREWDWEYIVHDEAGKGVNVERREEERVCTQTEYNIWEGGRWRMSELLRRNVAVVKVCMSVTTPGGSPKDRATDSSARMKQSALQHTAG